MNDKLILILFVLFVSVGVYTFDQYEVSQGKPSPVGRLLDFAGLSDYVNQYKEKFSKSIEQNVTFDKKEYLTRLKNSFDKISASRDKFLNQRNILLSDIVKINNDSQQDVEEYIQILNSELLKFWDKAAPLNRQLVQVLTLDPNNTEKYNTLVDGILNQFKQNISDSEVDSNELEEMLIKLQALAIKSKVDISYECNLNKVSAANNDNKVCLKDHINSLINGILRKQDRTIEETLNLIKVLQFEHRILTNNCLSTEKYLTQTDSEIKGELKALVERVVALSDSEFKQFLSYFDEVIANQNAMLDNLNINWKRFVNKYENSNAVLEQKIRELAYRNNEVSVKLIKDFDYYNEERKYLLEDIKVNERQLAEIIANRRLVIRDFQEEVFELDKILAGKKQISEVVEKRIRDRVINDTNKVRNKVDSIRNDSDRLMEYRKDNLAAPNTSVDDSMREIQRQNLNNLIDQKKNYKQPVNNRIEPVSSNISTKPSNINAENSMKAAEKQMEDKLMEQRRKTREQNRLVEDTTRKLEQQLSDQKRKLDSLR